MERKLIASLLLLCLAFSIGLAHAQIGGNDCESITFLNVPPDTYDCMKKQLQDYGIYVPVANYGVLSSNGVVAFFEWDEESILTVRIIQKPSFVSCETAANEITKFVEECHGS
jgi:hypothetical protein